MKATNIQEHIAFHLTNKTEPSKHDLQCFVGMIQTGEATLDDFFVVGGCDLSGSVRSAMHQELADPAAKTQQAALDAYEAAHVKAVAKAATIKAGLFNALEPPSENTTWSDVATVTEINRRLDSVIAFLHQTEE